MTTVRLTNSNVAGITSPVYIELYGSALEQNMDNDVVNFFLPTPPADWLTGGAPTDYKRSLFDMKNITEAYAITAEIDVDSNRDSGWNADPLATVNRVKANMRTLTQTGGTIKLYILDGTDTEEVDGIITSIKWSEDQQDQGPLEAPRILRVQLTFLVGQNFEE